MGYKIKAELLIYHRVLCFCKRYNSIYIPGIIQRNAPNSPGWLGAAASLGKAMAISCSLQPAKCGSDISKPVEYGCGYYHSPQLLMGTV